MSKEALTLDQRAKDFAEYYYNKFCHYKEVLTEEERKGLIEIGYIEAAKKSWIQTRSTIEYIKRIENDKEVLNDLIRDLQHFNANANDRIQKLEKQLEQNNEMDK